MDEVIGGLVMRLPIQYESMRTTLKPTKVDYSHRHNRVLRYGIRSNSQRSCCKDGGREGRIVPLVYAERLPAFLIHDLMRRCNILLDSNRGYPWLGTFARTREIREPCGDPLAISSRYEASRTCRFTGTANCPVSSHVVTFNLDARLHYAASDTGESAWLSLMPSELSV